MQNTEIEQPFEVTTRGAFPEIDAKVNVIIASVVAGVAVALSNGREALAASSGVDGNGEDAKASNALGGTDGKTSLPGGNGMPSANSIDENPTPDGTDGNKSPDAKDGVDGGEGTLTYQGLIDPEVYGDGTKYEAIPVEDRGDVTKIDSPPTIPEQSSEPVTPKVAPTNVKPADQAKPTTSQARTNETVNSTPAGIAVKDAPQDEPMEGTAASIPHFTVKPGIELVESKPATAAQANIKTDEALDPLGTILIATAAVVSLALSETQIRRRQTGKHSIRK